MCFEPTAALASMTAARSSSSARRSAPRALKKGACMKQSPVTDSTCTPLSFTSSPMRARPAEVISGFSRSRSWSSVHSMRGMPIACAAGNSDSQCSHGKAWILPSTIGERRPCMKPMRAT
jgi:hypothetical protein